MSLVVPCLRTFNNYLCAYATYRPEESQDEPQDEPQTEAEPSKEEAATNGGNEAEAMEAS